MKIKVCATEKIYVMYSKNRKVQKCAVNKHYKWNRSVQNQRAFIIIYGISRHLWL